MDRERIIAFMRARDLDNRKLAGLLGITEDKVSKSLTTSGKPRRWQGPEVAKLFELMQEAEPLVRTEVRGTGLSPAQLSEASGMPNAKPVPLLGTAYGKDVDDLEEIETTELRIAEILDYIPRPPSLATDDSAYAVEIMGSSMYPRFKEGERAFVSPRATVRIGDDVIVQLNAPPAEGSDISGQVTDVLIKELTGRTATYIELKQFRPEKTFRVPTSRVRAMHRVKGRL